MPSFEVKIHTFTYEKGLKDKEEFKLNLTLPNLEECEHLISQLLGYGDVTWHKFNIKRIQYMCNLIAKQKSISGEEDTILFKFKRVTSGKLRNFIIDIPSRRYCTQITHFACPGVKQTIYGAHRKFCQLTELSYLNNGLTDLFISSQDDNLNNDYISYEMSDVEEDKDMEDDEQGSVDEEEFEEGNHDQSQEYDDETEYDDDDAVIQNHISEYTPMAVDEETDTSDEFQSDEYAYESESD